MFSKYLLGVFTILALAISALAKDVQPTCGSDEQVVQVETSTRSNSTCSGQYQKQLNSTVKALATSATTALDKYEDVQKTKDPKSKKWELYTLSVGVGSSVSGGIDIFSGNFDTHIRLIFSKAENAALDD